MADALSRGRYDRAADWLGAAFPAACAGYSAAKIGPLFDIPAGVAAVSAAAAVFAAGYMVMASVTGGTSIFSIRLSSTDADESELVLDEVWRDVASELDELLLDRPLVDTRAAELRELLLDDALGVASPDSRVVQLFEPEQLRQRIDRHLANERAGKPGSGADASDALSQALAELKLSLQRA